MIAQENVLSGLAGHVASRIKLDLPDLKTCAAIAGRFSAEELRKQGSLVPAVYVSLLSAKLRDRQSQTSRFDLSMAAYVVTGPAQGRDRDADALVICQRVLARVDDNDWGLHHVGLQQGENPALQSLVTAAVRSAATSLWTVTWTQPVLLDAGVAFEPVPAALYVGGGLLGEPGPAHALVSGTDPEVAP